MQLLTAICPSSLMGINNAMRKFSWTAATLLTGFVRINFAVGEFGLLGTLVGLTVFALAAMLCGID